MDDTTRSLSGVPAEEIQKLWNLVGDIASLTDAEIDEQVADSDSFVTPRLAEVLRMIREEHGRQWS